MNTAEIEFTKNWWKNCVTDEAKLNRWLQKLQLTEIGGYYDYLQAFTRFEDVLDTRTVRIFSNIGEDEQKHSGLLLDLFEDRKIIPASNTDEAMVSTYWATMNAAIIDLDTFCAVNYYGEGLAAFRFEILYDHPDTPSDVKEFIAKALPDETFHRETLHRLSSENALYLIGQVHQDALTALKRA
jgi:hypothetical protein